MKESKEFTITREIAVAIINDDYSGLNENYEYYLDKWLKEYRIEWIVVDGEGNERFTQCDITGLWADCIDIIAYREQLGD